MATKKKKKVAKKATTKKAKPKGKGPTAEKPVRKSQPTPKRTILPASPLAAAKTAPHAATESRILDLEVRLAEAENRTKLAEEAREAAEAKVRDLEDALRPRPVGQSEHGPPRLGYTRVDGKSVPDPDERKLVALCVKLLRLLGPVEAVRHLDAKGVTLRSKPITRAKLAWMEKSMVSWASEAAA